MSTPTYFDSASDEVVENYLNRVAATRTFIDTFKFGFDIHSAIVKEMHRTGEHPFVIQSAIFNWLAEFAPSARVHAGGIGTNDMGEAVAYKLMWG